MSTVLKNVFSVLEAKNTPTTTESEKKAFWADDVEDEVLEGFTKVESNKRTSSPGHVAKANNIFNAKNQPTEADFEAACRMLPWTAKGEIVPGSEYANPSDALKNKVAGSGSASGSSSKRQGRKKAHKKAVTTADAASAPSWKEKETRIAALAWSGPAPKK
jgi:hypothetical protein